MSARLRRNTSTTSCMEKSSYRVIDAHAHLDELSDAVSDILRAQERGVAAIAGVGMNRESNERILRLAEEFPGFVIPCIGLHPWRVNKETVDDDLSFIAANVCRCAAVGEIGLDYKAKPKKALQKKVFRELLGLAKRFEKPVITHSRYSYQSTFEMVVEAGVEKAVFHWYSGPLELLDEIFAKNFYISATPALAYSKPHQAAVRKAPLANLVLETDCPERYGDLESRPEHVLRTLELAARVKELEPEEIAVATTRNAERLLCIHSKYFFVP